MSEHTPKQATPKRFLLRELIDQNTPMSEREWAAAEEIIRLQDQNKVLLAALQVCVEILTSAEVQSSVRVRGMAKAIREADKAIDKAKGETK